MRSVGQYLSQIYGSHTGTPLLNELMVFVAEYLIYLIPIALLYLWFSADEGKSKSVFIFVTIVVSLAISYTMGQFYAHPAPYSAGYETLITEAPENSFPSQHTTVVFAFTWSLFYLQDRWRKGFVVLVLASLVGLSRIYIGVHYPIDIAGAIGASILGFVLVYAARNVVMDFASLCINIEERGRSVLRSVL